MLENLSTELDKTESRLDMVSKKVAQVLQLSDGNLSNINKLHWIWFQDNSLSIKLKTINIKKT